MPDDLRAAAVRALVVVGDLDGASGDERFGHALGQQTRRLRLKIDQLIDRGVGGDLALQRLEFLTWSMAALRRRPKWGSKSWNGTPKSDCALTDLES